MKFCTLWAVFLLSLPVLNAGAAPDPSGPLFAASIKPGDLVSLQGKSLHRVDEAPLAHVRYFAIYYSASWCGPCRAFSPELVTFYNDVKPANPQFELILVCRDQSQPAMEAYIKKDGMKWPALTFAKVRSHKTLNQYAGPGIPCLVLVDAHGKVLSDSYKGETYVGPAKVEADIKRILNENPPTPEELAAAKAGESKTGSIPAHPASGTNFDEIFKKRPGVQ